MGEPASTHSRLYNTVRVMRKTRKWIMLSIWKGPCTYGHSTAQDSKVSHSRNLEYRLSLARNPACPVATKALQLVNLDSQVFWMPL